jgi:hypothetical protein
LHRYTFNHWSSVGQRMIRFFRSAQTGRTLKPARSLTPETLSSTWHETDTCKSPILSFVKRGNDGMVIRGTIVVDLQSLSPGQLASQLKCVSRANIIISSPKRRQRLSR